MLIHILKDHSGCCVEKRQDILMGFVCVRRGDRERKTGFDMNSWGKMKPGE